MSKLDNIGLRHSILTDKIYIARFGKDPTLALDKRECLSEFLSVLVSYVGVGNELRFRGGDEHYVVTLTTATKDQPHD